MRAFTVILVCGWAAGCAKTHEQVRALWTKDTAPPADMSAPVGFTVKPAQALTIARESRALSLKHVWHVYAGSRYYYIHDAFWGSRARLAYLQGLRVDGQTGEIIPR